MKGRLVLIFALVVGAGARLYHLGLRSLWFDEMLTQWLSGAGVSFSYLLEQLRNHDQTPPLYHLVTRVFVMGLGDAEWVLRLPAALAGIGAVGAVYLVGRRGCGCRFGGNAAALLLAVNPFAIWYSQEARPYSFMLCFALLSTHAFLVLLQEGPRRRWVDGYYVFVTALLLYSHPFGVFVVAGHCVAYVIAVWLRQARLRFFRLFVDLVLVGVCYLPWAPILVHAARVAMGSYWAADVTLGEIPVTYWLLANSTLAVVVFVALAVVGVAGERRRAGVWVVLMLAVLPVVAPVVASVVRRPMFTTRFAIPAVGGLCALGACGVSLLPRATWRWLALGVMMVLPWVPVTRAPERFGFPREKEHWRELGGYLHEQLRAGDVVMFTPGFMKLHWDYYVRRPEVRAVPFNGALPEISGLPAGARVWVVSPAPTSTQEGTPAFGLLLELLHSPRWRIVGHHAEGGILVLRLAENGVRDGG